MTSYLHISLQSFTNLPRKVGPQDQGDRQPAPAVAHPHPAHHVRLPRRMDHQRPSQGRCGDRPEWPPVQTVLVRVVGSLSSCRYQPAARK